jgi:predicted nuclease with TOPRIM domain
LKKILGKTDIEDALKRLDTLTTEEARLAIAETLKVTNRVDDKVDKVDDKVDKVDDKVDMVDDKVDKVDNTVNRVDTKVDNVDDKVGKVDTKVGKVDDKVDKVDDKVDKVDDKVDKVDNKVMVLIGGRESFPCNLRIPEHGYYSKRAVCKHRVTRKSAKVAISSGSLHKS